MKISIEIEQRDYINVIIPALNGCKFRARFEANGSVKLEPGCYLLMNLVQGADRWFLDKWETSGREPFEIAVTPETKLEMKATRPCLRCGGSLHAPRA